MKLAMHSEHRTLYYNSTHSSEYVYAWFGKVSPIDNLPGFDVTAEFFKKRFPLSGFGGDYKVWSLPWDTYDISSLKEFAKTFHLDLVERLNKNVEERKDGKGTRHLAKDIQKDIDLSEWTHLELEAFVEPEEVLSSEIPVVGAQIPTNIKRDSVNHKDTEDRLTPAFISNSAVPIEPCSMISEVERITANDVTDYFYSMFSTLRIRTDKFTMRGLDGQPLEDHMLLEKASEGKECKYRIVFVQVNCDGSAAESRVYPHLGEGVSGREMVCFLDGLAALIVR